MRFISCLGAALAAALLLAGAARAGDFGSERPLVATSAHCPAAFALYAKTIKPLYFVVSEARDFCLYSYCQDACSKANARNAALYRCEQTSAQSCRVYAAYGRIVEPGLL